VSQPTGRASDDSAARATHPPVKAVEAGRSRGGLELLRRRPSARTTTGALPAQPTSLVGRARDLALARGLVLRDDVRLLTLTGPAGVGKTRLAIALAERLAARFTDGVGFVDLAPIADPHQVVPTILRSLGAPPAGGRQAIRALQDFLELREMLLVFDNFEHLLEAAPRLAEILTECPSVKLVVTSRAALHLRWEHVLAVRPLALPAPGPSPSLTMLARTPAVSLLVERVRQADRAFALTSENAPAVAELCIRLDGLPLAIELAAHRLSRSSLAAILQRLTQLPEGRTTPTRPAAGRSQALGRGARDLPPRQQSLDAAMAWSYELLAPDERAVFRRLAVFEGGLTLEAAQAVCSFATNASGEPWAPDAVEDLMTRLVDSSLVVCDRRPGRGQPRYRLLETIRQYGADRLVEAGEEVAARDAHRDWYLRHAEAVDPELRSGGEPDPGRRPAQRRAVVVPAPAGPDRRGPSAARASAHVRAGAAERPREAAERRRPDRL
jgi:predicted ATPase